MVYAGRGEITGTPVFIQPVTQFFAGKKENPLLERGK
jgi:hypothetical protein